MKIQEIARLAGVSPSTVSRVFGLHPNISVSFFQIIFLFSLEIANVGNYNKRST